MKKKTTLTKMHIAPSTVRYDAVAARDSNEVGQILAGTRIPKFFTDDPEPA